MASIKRIEGKNGVSFKITVTQGRDQNGKQMRHYLTWTPERLMTERQMKKAVEQAAFEFEQAITQVNASLTLFSATLNSALYEPLVTCFFEVVRQMCAKSSKFNGFAKKEKAHNSHGCALFSWLRR